MVIQTNPSLYEEPDLHRTRDCSNYDLLHDLVLLCSSSGYQMCVFTHVVRYERVRLTLFTHNPLVLIFLSQNILVC